MTEELPIELKALNRYFIAHKDLEEARRYLLAYIDLMANSNPNYQDHCEAILKAVVVAYSKPFTESYGRGFATKLVQAEELESLKYEALKLHKDLLDRRNTAIAHSDWKVINSIIIDQEGTSQLRKTPIYQIQEKLDIKAFLDLINNVSKECRAKSIPY